MVTSGLMASWNMSHIHVWLLNDIDQGQTGLFVNRFYN